MSTMNPEQVAGIVGRYVFDGLYPNRRELIAGGVRAYDINAAVKAGTITPRDSNPVTYALHASSPRVPSLEEMEQRERGALRYAIRNVAHTQPPSLRDLPDIGPDAAVKPDDIVPGRFILRYTDRTDATEGGEIGVELPCCERSSVRVPWSLRDERHTVVCIGRLCLRTWRLYLRRESDGGWGASFILADVPFLISRMRRTPK